MGATYNLLGIMFCLMGTNIAIDRENVKNYFLKQGIIIFLVFMSKQNIGILYAFANVLIETVIYPKNRLKNVIKIILFPTIGFVMYGIYLYVNESLIDFINYTFLGMKEFGRNIFINSEGIGWIVIDTIMILFISNVLKNKLYKQEQIQIILTLFIIGICILLIGYPIADYWHMTIASIILIINSIYILQTNLDIKIDKKIINILLIITITVMLTITMFKLWIYLYNHCEDKTNRFYLITINNDQKAKIETMTKYISNADKKVIIISPEAGKFYINLNMESNGILDLPWNGNLGKNGAQSLIDKLKSYEDVYALMYQKKEGWQEVDEFRSFVENNYKKIDEI